MPELTAAWQGWIADNLDDGAVVDDVVARLITQGVAADAAWAVVARSLAAALRRRNALLGVQVALAALAPDDAVPRRPTISRAAFLREHYAAQRPLILTGPLEIPWTFASLAAHHGALEVEVQDGREGAPDRYQRDFERFCRRMRLGELLARITATPTSNDVYLTAKNRLLAQPGAAVLLGDLPPLPDLLAAPCVDNVAVWIGPAGTLTPLHHDWVSAAIVQVCGRKRFHLIPPGAAPRLRNRDGRFADIDCEAGVPPGVPVSEVVLAPGELLFVPVGWWHQARALAPSVSVTLTGFAYPNRYPWDADTSR